MQHAREDCRIAYNGLSIYQNSAAKDDAAFIWRETSDCRMMTREGTEDSQADINIHMRQARRACPYGFAARHRNSVKGIDTRPPAHATI